MLLYYPACSLASEVILILLFSVLVMRPGSCKLLHFKTLVLLLFQAFHPRIHLWPRQSHQKWPPTLSRPTAELQLQVCACVYARTFKVELIPWDILFFLHRIPCLHWCNPVTLPSSFVICPGIYNLLLPVCVYVCVGARVCVFIHTLRVSCSLVWHWLNEHACWLWECVFLLPPDQFQRELPAAIPRPGPHPLLPAWGVPPSV